VKTQHSHSDDHAAILDKISKLLRLADRTRGATEHEAKVALAKAHELMTRYNINTASIRVDAENGNNGANSNPSVNTTKVNLPKSLNPADLLILSLLQNYFNVRVILSPTWKNTPVDIIGMPLDVEYAVYVFHFLRETFFRCWNEFKRTTVCPDRKSYYRGLHDGLKEAIITAKKNAQSAYSQEQYGKYQLALVNAKALIERHVAEHYGKLKHRNQRRTNLHSESYGAGKVRGATITINRPLAAA